MISNKENLIISNFFSWYISRIVRKNFAAINFNHIEADPKKAVLLLANHYSWWDGFIYFHLNKLLFKKKFHVMILEDTIRKNPMLKYVGSFSVLKASKDILTALDYVAVLIQNPENLVLIFPQGKLHSNFNTDIVFQSGLKRIIAANDKNFDYIFAASFTENFQKKTPTVFINLEKHAAAKLAGFKSVETAYGAHYQKSLALQTAIVK